MTPERFAEVMRETQYVHHEDAEFDNAGDFDEWAIDLLAAIDAAPPARADVDGLVALGSAVTDLLALMDSFSWPTENSAFGPAFARLRAALLAGDKAEAPPTLCVRHPGGQGP